MKRPSDRGPLNKYWNPWSDLLLKDTGDHYNPSYSKDNDKKFFFPFQKARNNESSSQQKKTNNLYNPFNSFWGKCPHE